LINRQIKIRSYLYFFRI